MYSLDVVVLDRVKLFETGLPEQITRMFRIYSKLKIIESIISKSKKLKKQNNPIIMILNSILLMTSKISSKMVMKL